MCWHVRERVSYGKSIKVAPQISNLSFISKDRFFYFAGRLPPEMIPGRFLIRVQAGKPKSPGTDEDRRKTAKKGMRNHDREHCSSEAHHRHRPEERRPVRSGPHLGCRAHRGGRRVEAHRFEFSQFRRHEAELHDRHVLPRYHSHAAEDLPIGCHRPARRRGEPNPHVERDAAGEHCV